MITLLSQKLCNNKNTFDNKNTEDVRSSRNTESQNMGGAVT